MSRGAIITDIFALLAVLLGFMLAFRQRPLRRWLARIFPTPPDHPTLTIRPEGDDPIHYAMIIAGVMLMAFGVLIFAFTTGYELMTTAPPG
jgi:hypothetical protein